LPRLYEPLEGSIKIDGIDISDISLSSLRSQFALVSQDIVLFNDTLRANISYSVTGVGDERLMEIAHAADLADFVAAQPLGLDTNIGERGLQLSGGQRQRVAIARAILRDAPILLLDEATSALDSQSESRIKAAIDNLRIGRTTLIVAHRLSTIQNADWIYVVESGQIVEEGTHAELLQRNGRYHSLYRNHETNG
jgi:subfamily B ATP-binding cassette protein MsbA